MGLTIIFRPTPAAAGTLPSNPFNQLLINSIAAAGQGIEVLIASAFFQEGAWGPYCALDEPNFLPNLVAANATLVTVGLYGIGPWPAHYGLFANRTVAALGAARSINLKYIPTKWHSKVFIISDANSNPLFGIIGSSNITTNAFGSVGNPTKLNANWNAETDVVLWPDGNPAIDGLMVEFARNTLGQFPPAIIARYDPADNNQVTIERRLREARSAILGDNFPDQLPDTLERV